MKQFTFDVKALVTVHVEAENEAAARLMVDDRLAIALEGIQVSGPGRNACSSTPPASTASTT